MLLRKAEMQGGQSILENSSATICNDSCNDLQRYCNDSHNKIEPKYIVCIKLECVFRYETRQSYTLFNGFGEFLSELFW